MSVVIAIDPGASGGVAVSAFGKTVCHAMPATDGDRLELIRSFKEVADVECVECVCVLEEVSGFAGQAQPGSAMFKFGEGYGFLKGAAQALGIKLVLVRPQEWQKPFGLGTASRCGSKREWKNKLKAEAQRRFPHLTVTLATADALLILEWWVRRTGQEPRGEPRSASVPATNGAECGQPGGPSLPELDDGAQPKFGLPVEVRPPKCAPCLKTFSAGDVCLRPAAEQETKKQKRNENAA